MQADDILHFWFEELSPEQHFAQEDAIDAMIRVRFGATLEAARRCELWNWRSRPQGRLAEIVVLDQFSRNIHRGSPLAFAQDAQALALAQELVAGGHDQALAPARRAFAYMPYMHSESLVVECGQHFRQSAAEVATAAALDFLAHFGLIEPVAGRPAAGPQHRYELLETCMVRTPDFRFARPLLGFEVFARGELIATDGPHEIRALCDDCTVMMPTREPIVGREAVYLTRPL